MKTFKLFLLGAFLSVFSFSIAQVSANVSIAAPPIWGPTVTTQEYYYLPDIDSYYDIPQSKFIYLNNGIWIRSNSLPRRYRSYDLKTGNVVVLNDYKGPNPYSHYKAHKIKYYNPNNNWKKTKVKGRYHDNGVHRGMEKGNKKVKN